MRAGFIPGSSIIEPLEDTLFCLENFAFGTSPVIRHIFPCSSAGYAVFGVSLERVINIVALQAYPAFTFLVLCQICSTPPIASAHLIFTWIFMNAPVRAIHVTNWSGEYRVHGVPGGVNTAVLHEEVPEFFPQR